MDPSRYRQRAYSLRQRVTTGVQDRLGRRSSDSTCDAPGASTPIWQAGTYEARYEEHARALPIEVSIGGGDYDVMGRILLSAIVDAGLKPTNTLVDFGCGTGRLACHVIPWLDGGSYVGIDISPTMLAQAQDQLANEIASSSATVSWLHQTNEEFAVADNSVDMICAFSVFTHMEHEDTYRYLVAAKRIVAPGGCFVASVLTMDLPAARDVFVESASHPLTDRWSRVRNITTTYELFATVAELAGWSVERWHIGTEESIPLLGDEQRGVAVGQSIAILRR